MTNVNVPSYVEYELITVDVRTALSTRLRS